MPKFVNCAIHTDSFNTLHVVATDDNGQLFLSSNKGPFAALPDHPVIAAQKLADAEKAKAAADAEKAKADKAAADAKAAAAKK